MYMYLVCLLWGQRTLGIACDEMAPGQLRCKEGHHHGSHSPNLMKRSRETEKVKVKVKVRDRDGFI